MNVIKINNCQSQNTTVSDLSWGVSASICWWCPAWEHVKHVLIFSVESYNCRESTQCHMGTVAKTTWIYLVFDFEWIFGCCTFRQLLLLSDISWHSHSPSWLIVGHDPQSRDWAIEYWWFTLKMTRLTESCNLLTQCHVAHKKASEYIMLALKRKDNWNSEFIPLWHHCDVQNLKYWIHFAFLWL